MILNLLPSLRCEEMLPFKNNMYQGIDNYFFESLVFQSPSATLQSHIATRIETGKKYYITCYKLWKDMPEINKVCARIRYICNNLHLFHCCEIFFDHNLISLKSLRPTNIGFMIHTLYVVEPFPVRSLSLEYLDHTIPFETLLKGFNSLTKMICKLNDDGFIYGAISSSTVIISDDDFKLRPPPICPKLYPRAIISPPVSSEHNFYISDELKFYIPPGGFSDSFGLGTLLSSFILFDGCPIFSCFSRSELRSKIQNAIEKYELPEIIVSLLNEEVEINDEVLETISKFIRNRRSTLTRQKIPKTKTNRIDMPIEIDHHENYDITKYNNGIGARNFPMAQVKDHESQEIFNIKKVKQFKPVDPVNIASGFVIKIGPISTKLKGDIELNIHYEGVDLRDSKESRKWRHRTKIFQVNVENKAIEITKREFDLEIINKYKDTSNTIFQGRINMAEDDLNLSVQYEENKKTKIPIHFQIL